MRRRSPLPRHLIIEDVGLNETRTGFVRTLQAMGASIELEPERLEGNEPVGRIVVESGRQLPASKSAVQSLILEHDRRAPDAYSDRCESRRPNGHPRRKGTQGQGHRPHRDHGCRASPIRRRGRRARGRFRHPTIQSHEREIVGAASRPSRYLCRDDLGKLAGGTDDHVRLGAGERIVSGLSRVSRPAASVSHFEQV